MYQYKENQKGFTLFETAIVVIISGVLLSMAVGVYSQYLEKKRIYETQARLDTVNTAMARFFSVYGRYPCPSSLTAVIGDANFGVETDCTTSALPPGVFVATGEINHDGNVLTPKIPTDIRTGAIPFVTLQEGSALFPGEALYESPFQIGFEDTTDSYNNRFTYVITELQATENYFPRLGAIRIEDENTPPNSLSINGDDNNVNYIIISHGKNAEGAYGVSGVPYGGVACPTTSPAHEQENCDNDDLYISSLRYDTGPNQFDDTINFQTWANYYLWDLADTPGVTNIYNLNVGNVGIGGTNPQEKLHVYQGNAVADEHALGDASVMAQEYCNFDASGAVNCFTPHTIGGDTSDCDTLFSADEENVAMNIIANNTIGCQTIYDGSQVVDCSAVPGEFLIGFSYSQATKTLTPTCGVP